MLYVFDIFKWTLNVYIVSMSLNKITYLKLDKSMSFRSPQYYIEMARNYYYKIRDTKFKRFLSCTLAFWSKIEILGRRAWDVFYLTYLDISTTMIWSVFSCTNRFFFDTRNMVTLVSTIRHYIFHYISSDQLQWNLRKVYLRI